MLLLIFDHPNFYIILKKNLQTVFRTTAYALVFTLISVSVRAQKLSNVQQGSVRAPAKVKVDGKLNEWPETFQAYNKATALFYTIANDGETLYLVMKSANKANSSKIIGGGINFTINAGNKKKDKEKDAFVIKFPIVDMANLQGMIMQRMRPQNGPPQPLDSAAVAGIRKQIISSIKEIGISGFKDIPDSLISIYNEYQIKAAIDVDSQNNAIVEIAIPLKYLHMAGNNTAFNYNIRLNGLQLNFGGGNAGFRPPAGGFQGGGGMPNGGGGGFQGGGGMPRGMGDMAAMLSPTDFSGTYTLSPEK